jgi:hypothetical protein
VLLRDVQVPVFFHKIIYPLLVCLF